MNATSEMSVILDEFFIVFVTISSSSSLAHTPDLHDHSPLSAAVTTKLLLLQQWQHQPEYACLQELRAQLWQSVKIQES